MLSSDILLHNFLDTTNVFQIPKSPMQIGNEIFAPESQTHLRKLFEACEYLNAFSAKSNLCRMLRGYYPNRVEKK